MGKMSSKGEKWGSPSEYCNILGKEHRWLKGEQRHTRGSERVLLYWTPWDVEEKRPEYKALGEKGRWWRAFI